MKVRSRSPALCKYWPDYSGNTANKEPLHPSKDATAQFDGIVSDIFTISYKHTFYNSEQGFVLRRVGHSLNSEGLRYL